MLDVGSRKPGEGEKQGRTSGSLAWRLARGETQTSAEDASFIWVLTGDGVTIRYSCALDEYEVVQNGEVSRKRSWYDGAFEHKGLFRKEERDWKMVYLARKGDTFKRNVW